MKWLLRIVVALAALIVVVVAGGYAWLSSSLPKTSGEIAVNGSRAPVEIIRDEHAVPHIFAANEADAFYALGFVHAQDRLFQMDMMRMAGRGRLSELFGPLTLDHDRLMRTLDLVGQAEATLAALKPDERKILEAYAAGVNGFLAARSGTLPPEFLLLGHAPEPWQPLDSIMWGKLMALQLSGNWREELTRARLASRLEPDLLEQLWPNWPEDRATTLALADLYRALDLDRLASGLPPPLGPAQASNEWVLAGARTQSGKPLLVNDPHLALGAPGQWYLARLETPELRLVGATAPGVPGVILGHNGRIAWGFTTTNADTFDLFVERIAENDPGRYVTPDGSRPFATRTETIKVKDKPDVTITVRATRHGPVISDVIRTAGMVAPARDVIALSMPAFHVVDRTPAALFGLNRAGNWQEFVDALSNWHAPMQNIVYADRDGHIGFYSPALLPRRKSGKGWLPQPGWTDAHDWDGFVPYTDLPHALDPPRGQIVNANNRIVPDEFPVFIGRDWDAPYRARRITDLIEAKPVHDLRSMSEMLGDDVSVLARDLLPRLVSISVTGTRSREALDLLRTWSGAMDRNRPEPLIFHGWMRELTLRLISDELAGRFPELVREHPALLRAALDGSAKFCDDTRTPGQESCPEQVEAALENAIDTLTEEYGKEMNAWRWGDAHYAPFRHNVLSRIPVLKDLVAFRVPTDGDYYTINRGAGRISDPLHPFAHVHGPSLRAIYDLADLDESLFMIAPGQSGNPLSEHWGDLAQAWADNHQFRIRGTREALRATGSVLILAPR